MFVENEHWSIIIKITKNVKRNEWNVIMRKLTTERFISEATEIHGDEYDYSNVLYVHSKEKVKIICKTHGEFLQRPDAHLRGQRCLKCERRMTIPEFIQKASEVHKSVYRYDKFVYVSARTKGIITCEKHGGFLQTPDNHLRGNGCPRCKGETTGNLKRGNRIDFISGAVKCHGNLYDYSEFIYVTRFIKGIIICPKHGRFNQCPGNHLKGDGCPKCSPMISHKELSFLNYLNIPDTPATRQVKILRKKVDGYDPVNKIVYEFLGDYWHGNPQKYDSNNVHPSIKKSFGEVYKNTMDRFQLLQAAGNVVKYVWESDWKKFNTHVSSSLKLRTL